jgi:hypothetical protein
MGTSDKEMAPQESPTPRDPAQRERTPMDTTQSSAPAHPPTEDRDDTIEAHYASLERPCACIEGWVYLGVEEDGIERTEAVACRRCGRGA